MAAAKLRREKLMKFKQFLARQDLIGFSIFALIFLGYAGFAIFGLLREGQGSDLIIGQELVTLVAALVGGFGPM